MTINLFVVTLLYALTIGSAYVLIASSLSLIFGVMGVVNFAHGAFAMLGAYLGYQLIQTGMNFWIVLVVSPLIIGILALVLEVLTLRPFYKMGHIGQLFQFLLTFGVAMVIANVVLQIWGGEVLGINKPDILKGVVHVLDIYYPKFRVFVLIVSTILIVLLWLVISRTKWGIILQAGMHNKELVEAFGINMSIIFSVVFGIGSALAAVAGVILGTMRSLSPVMDGELIMGGFVAVVIGGMGSFRGAALGALILGLAESFGAQFLSGFASFIVMGLMVIVLLLKPEGLVKGV